MGLKERGVPSLMTHWIITFIITSWMVTQQGVHQSCSPLRVISGSTMSCLIGKANLAYISLQRVRIRWLLINLQKLNGNFEELEVSSFAWTLQRKKMTNLCPALKYNNLLLHREIFLQFCTVPLQYKLYKIHYYIQCNRSSKTCSETGEFLFLKHFL